MRAAATDVESARCTLRLALVCGNSRSGTTMTARVLGRADEVHTFRELHFFEGLWDPTSEPSALPPNEARALVRRLLSVERGGLRTPAPDAEVDADAAAVLDEVGAAVTAPDLYAATLAHEAHRDGASVACDQTPRNVYYLAEILALFPAARAVVVVRDPRDVLLSQKRRWRRAERGVANMSRREVARLWASYHPVTTSMLWRSGMAAANRLADHPRVMVVRFEDLVSDSGVTARQLCDFVGITYRADLVAVPRTGSSHHPADQSATGLDPAAAGRWRRGGLRSGEIAVCERITGEQLEGAGYARSGARVGPFDAARLAASYLVKSVLALLLNATRARRMLTAGTRRLGRRATARTA
jgi:hypothetical protein